MNLATLIGQDVVDKIQRAGAIPTSVGELLDELAFEQLATNKDAYHMRFIQAVLWPMVHDGLKLFDVPLDVSELCKSIHLRFGEYRLPYSPLVVKLPDDPRYFALQINRHGLLAISWEPPEQGANFMFIEITDPDDLLSDDPGDSAQLLHRLYTAATICYHSGQLLHKLPTTGKSRRARAINQGHQIKLVQNVEWIRQHYVKRSEPTGQTKAPHERRAHSRKIGHRIIDVKACVIHKDRYEKPVTTVIS